MASTKKPTYKVETKLAPERKRRKSDLVLMWQSAMDVTAIVVKELWTTIIRLWELIQIWFSSSDRFLIQTWLEKYLPYVPEDFSESWRDGRLLAILLNKLQPGCFPDAYHLDPDYGLKNVYRIFDALEIYFGIHPNVSVEEIVTCSNGSDSKLFAILLELKNITDSQPENKETKPEPAEKVESTGRDRSCTVKGTGLAIGFVGRISNFSIFCATIADLDVVVEIKGPTSVCSERITKRSPRKRRSGFSFQYAKYLTRSASLTENNNSLDLEEDHDDLEKRIIHLEYEIIGNQISLAYKPREKGEHKVTILWHGRHVSDSPYLVTIEDPSEVVATKRVIPLKSAFKNAGASEKDDSRKISFLDQNSQINCVKQEDRRNYKEKIAGKVISRKLIRYIVRISGKDIPVNADSIESLATELLKMDYDIESCPSFHRRNSWGFAGDAERKKSVIRQFGIDIRELDAQISQKRTRSLSMYPSSKKKLERSDSFDSLSSKLNCLNEDVFENNGKASENENNYAYLNEDATILDNEIRSDSPTVTLPDTYSQNVTNEAILLSELTGSKFDKSLEVRSNDVTEVEKISSLSINKTQPKKIDRPEDDLFSNVLLCSSSFKCNLINKDKANDMSISYQCTDKNLIVDRSKLNHITKNVNTFSKSKIFWMCPKVNIYQKKIYKCSHKNIILKIFFRKILSRKENSEFLPVVIYRKIEVISKHMFQRKRQTFSYSKVSKNVQVNHMKKAIDPAFKHEKYASGIISEKFSNKMLNISPELITKNKEYKKYNYIDLKCTTNKEPKINFDVSPVNVNEPLQIPYDYPSSKNILEEPKAAKVTLKHNFNSTPNSSICSLMKIKDENKILNHQRIPVLTTTKPVIFHGDYEDSNLTQPEEKTKSTYSKLSRPLRIHTLKTFGQFDFTQFNPSLDSDNAISPVKSQIVHWENTLSPENECASSMKLREASDIEQGNVKEKLAFWECRSKESLENSSPLNNRKINLIVNKKISRSIPDPSKNDDLQKLHCSEKSSTTPVATTEEKNNTFTNEGTNATTKIQTDNNISLEFQTNSGKVRSLSFSDPVVSEAATDKAELVSSFLSSESSRRDYFDLSSDATSDQYDSDETEDSGGDYLLHSTEDEYIDDEIAERATEYWGDLSIVKNWKVPNGQANEQSFLDEQFLKNYSHRDKSYPEECKVFGIAIYYGYVALKNRFQVFTGDSGFGNLSVSIQGIRNHEVSLVNVAYVRNDIYEVTYQVMTAGYYLIWIRWMDTDVPGSPFVCKVTF